MNGDVLRLEPCMHLGSELFHELVENVAFLFDALRVYEVLHLIMAEVLRQGSLAKR